MLKETPEEVLFYILNHVCDCPENSNSVDMKQEIQSCLGGRLASDFDYDELFIPRLLMCHPAHPRSPAITRSQIETAVTINDFAYIYLQGTLFVLYHTTPNGWKLQVSLSMCWGCFGDHSHVGGGCWGVLCNCCGGTGWESGNLDFCAGRELPANLEVCVVTNSPRAAFTHLLSIQCPLLDSVRDEISLNISPALVIGRIAKLEIIRSTSRHLAIMEQNNPGEWCLTAFVELCQVCGGHGKNPKNENAFCPACGGLKWGKAGDLQYCRNYALMSYKLQD